MDDRWADYTKVLTELFKPLADMAGLGNSFVILPASAMPAPGVCVTETATIYLADGLFGTARPEDLTDPNYWIRHPEVFGIVLHEVLHRLFSPEDWSGWVNSIVETYGKPVAQVAILMEEARIEAVGIRELGPGSGYAKRSFPPLSPMMIVALKYSADRLISRGAAESAKSGAPVGSRERLSRLMILTMGRLAGGSAERHAGNNIDHSMALIEKATTPEFRQQAHSILRKATEAPVAKYLSDPAYEWVRLMQAWTEPVPEKPEPEEDGGCGGLPEGSDEPDDTGEAQDSGGDEPDDLGQQPEPSDTGERDDDSEESESGTPGGDDEDRAEDDSEESPGSEGGSDEDSEDDSEDHDDESRDTSGDPQPDGETQPPERNLDEELRDLFEELERQDSEEDTSSDEERAEHQRAAETEMTEALASSAEELTKVRETRTGTRSTARAKWGRN